MSVENRVVAPSTVPKKLPPCLNSMCCHGLRARSAASNGRCFEWYSNPVLRSRCRTGLNKGEAGTELTGAVFFHERREIRDFSRPRRFVHRPSTWL
ncbi:Tn3 family transposase [Ensifer sp. NBAIM29]|nr:Tn3 family transposase [Ensifer sp. NBAIM29]